jgi:hypothetical protein
MRTYKVFIEELPYQSVSGYCRRLMEQGADPDSRVEAYRKNGTLCLIVKSIAKAAEICAYDDVRKGPMWGKYHPFKKTNQ